MNARSEIHSSCLHKPKFHRFGTDESVLMDEKVPEETNHFSIIESNIENRVNNRLFNSHICHLASIPEITTNLTIDV